MHEEALRETCSRAEVQGISREVQSDQQASEQSGRTACPACGSHDIAARPHNLTQCSDCCHVYQTDLTVSMVYDADYAHQYDHRPHQQMSEIRWNFIQSTLNLPPGSRVLDIGYGNGAFLKHASSAGMDIYGIDVHNEDFGIPVVDYDTTLTFDAICFFDSLEHFPDFSSILRLKARHAVVSIPHAPDFLLSAPTTWRHYKPGEHLHYFSPSSLDRLMAAWGLPARLAAGFPEDTLRGKLTVGGRVYDNIYTAVYRRDAGARTAQP